MAADERATVGSLYNVSDDTPVRRHAFYSKLAELLGAPQPRFVPLPTGATVPPHERGQRRIVSRRMKEELRVRLRYSNYEAGLIASV